MAIGHAYYLYAYGRLHRVKGLLARVFRDVDEMISVFLDIDV